MLEKLKHNETVENIRKIKKHNRSKFLKKLENLKKYN